VLECVKRFKERKETCFGVRVKCLMFLSGFNQSWVFPPDIF
jgi:hypothetical protein